MEEIVGIQKPILIFIGYLNTQNAFIICFKLVPLVNSFSLFEEFWLKYSKEVDSSFLRTIKYLELYLLPSFLLSTTQWIPLF